MCQARIGIAVGHVAVFEPHDPWTDAVQVDRSDDRPVITFGIDLDQVDVIHSRRPQGALDRVAGYLLNDNIAVANAMLTQMLPVKRSGHRGMASMAVQIASAFIFGDRRTQ